MKRGQLVPVQVGHINIGTCHIFDLMTNFKSVVKYIFLSSFER